MHSVATKPSNSEVLYVLCWLFQTKYAVAIMYHKLGKKF